MPEDQKSRLVVLSGAGMSAESGLNTFRDAGGLWEGHDINDVATPEGWLRDMDLVLDFYNQRRRSLIEVKPNAGHLALARLEEKYRVTIITQNVDDLHERAGSTHIIHLHGELRKARSTRFPDLVYPWDRDIARGDLCDHGSQLRPHIVWFGEAVPMIEEASEHVSKADIILIVGTSMQVYPAAGLVQFAPEMSEIYYVDPNPQISFELSYRPHLRIVREKAGVGIPKLVDELLEVSQFGF